MPHHPSLSEVLESQQSGEWMDLPIVGVTLRDWVDSENGKGDVITPELYLVCGATTSEFGRFKISRIAVDVKEVEESSIQNLEGKFPLGCINYDESDSPSINICVSSRFLANLIPFLAAKPEGMKLRISVPSWDDEAAKCLPIMSYQIIYETPEKI